AMATGVDMARLYAVEIKAQNAADAALLGAVATIDTIPADQEIVRLFNANFPSNYLGTNNTSIVLTSPSDGLYQAQLSITVPTLLHIFDSKAIPITSQVTQGFNKIS